MEGGQKASRVLYEIKAVNVKRRLQTAGCSLLTYLVGPLYAMWRIRPPLDPPNFPCLVQFSMPYPKRGPVFPLALLPPIFSMSTEACLVCVCHLRSNIGLLWCCRLLAFSGRGRSRSIFCWPVQP